MYKRQAIRSRYIVPPIFLVIIIAGFVLSSKCPYVFGYSTLDTIKQNDYKIAEKKINATFGETNQVALIFPFTDYESEASLLDVYKRQVKALAEVIDCLVERHGSRGKLRDRGREHLLRRVDADEHLVDGGDRAVDIVRGALCHICLLYTSRCV